MNRLLVILCVLAAASPLATAADEVRLTGRQELATEVPATAEQRVFEFAATVTVNASAEAYVKLMPTPWNPAYRNGTVDGPGWWTTVDFGPAASAGETKGSTNGTTIVAVGPVEQGSSYTVRLRVHAPAGALAEPLEYEIGYTFALDAFSMGDGGGGSGGSLDPSRAVTATITVMEASSSAQEGAAFAVDVAYLPVVLLVAAIAILGTVRWVQSRRTRGGGE